MNLREKKRDIKRVESIKKEYKDEIQELLKVFPKVCTYAFFSSFLPHCVDFGLQCELYKVQFQLYSHVCHTIEIK